MSDEIQKTILLVEKADSAMDRKRELEHYGYQVILIKSYKKAAEMVFLRGLMSMNPRDSG